MANEESIQEYILRCYELLKDKISPIIPSKIRFETLDKTNQEPCSSVIINTIFVNLSSIQKRLLNMDFTALPKQAIEEAKRLEIVKIVIHELAHCAQYIPYQSLVSLASEGYYYQYCKYESAVEGYVNRFLRDNWDLLKQLDISHRVLYKQIPRNQKNAEFVACKDKHDKIKSVLCMWVYSFPLATALPESFISKFDEFVSIILEYETKDTKQTVTIKHDTWCDNVEEVLDLMVAICLQSHLYPNSLSLVSNISIGNQLVVSFTLTKGK